MAKRKPLNVTPKEETRAPVQTDKRVTGQTARKGRVTLVTYTDPAVKKTVETHRSREGHNTSRAISRSHKRPVQEERETADHVTA